MHGGRLDDGERIVFTLMRSALGCVVLSLSLGAFAALYYLPAIGETMAAAGVSLVQLRPLHTTFASAWIFLGAVTVVSRFLFASFGPPGDGDKLRFKAQLVCWGLAGLGVLVTLPLGITSGREYLGFHPVFSLLIYVGWLLFAWTFFSKVWRGFWQRPVYVYMWSAGILFFLYTFAEGHAYLLPGVRDQPVVDLQIQFKSCGSLVASFNQMVYGCLIYIAERITRDKRIAQSRITFSLFGIGLLNSFTNSAHHTYHIPQDHFIKWVAFVVSMLEIIILVEVFKEVSKLLSGERKSSLDFNVTARFVHLSKCWNLFLLTLALLISVPPLNALIHGTHVVMGHAMGSEIAIDSYLLLAAFAYLLAEMFPKRETLRAVLHSDAVARAIGGLNIGLVGLVSWLLIAGLTTGVSRYLGQSAPAWLDDFPYPFAVFGLAVGWYLARLLWLWSPLLLRPEQHRQWYGSPSTTVVSRTADVSSS